MPKTFVTPNEAAPVFTAPGAPVFVAPPAESPKRETPAGAPPEPLREARLSGPGDKRRRGGMIVTRSWQELPSTLTPEQIQALMGDPSITVRLK